VSLTAPTMLSIDEQSWRSKLGYIVVPSVLPTLSHSQPTGNSANESSTRCMCWIACSRPNSVYPSCCMTRMSIHACPADENGIIRIANPLITLPGHPPQTWSLSMPAASAQQNVLAQKRL